MVVVRGTVPRPAAEVWALLRAFGARWHPAIAQMHEEPGGIRVFTTHGDPTLYREKLTFLSDGDQTLGYTMLEGIKGCSAYHATVQATETPQGCEVLWQAEISAEEPRLTAISEGTKAIFAEGIAALADASLIRREACAGMALLTNGRRGTELTLFLHGIGGAKENWLPQLTALDRPAAALDLRGYGDSPLGTAQSRLEDHFSDILAIKSAFGADRLHLVGLSFGAWIATAFACAHPEVLSHLTLIGGCTGMSEAPPAEREAFRLSREVPLSQGKTPADFAAAVVQVIAGPNASSQTRNALRDSMSAISIATYRDALTLFTNPPGQHDFSRLTMPVTLLTGEHDRLAPPSEIRAVARRIAAHTPTRFEIIQGAGHVCAMEDPAQVNRFL